MLLKILRSKSIKRDAVVSWFKNPEKPTDAGNTVGLNNITLPKKTVR